MYVSESVCAHVSYFPARQLRYLPIKISCYYWKIFGTPNLYKVRYIYTYVIFIYTYIHILIYTCIYVYVCAHAVVIRYPSGLLWQINFQAKNFRAMYVCLHIHVFAFVCMTVYCCMRVGN